MGKYSQGIVLLVFY